MKTAIQIENDKSEVMKAVRGLEPKHPTFKAHLRKCQKLDNIKQVVVAMQPSDEYMQRTAEKLKNRIALLEEQRDKLQPPHLRGKEITKYRTEYNKLNDMQKLKEQLFVAQYLLGQIQVV